MSALVISPELTLVDPELRSLAIAALPWPNLSPPAPLSRSASPAASVAHGSARLSSPTLAAQPAPILVAAAVYLVATAIRTLAIDVAIIAGLMLLVLLANLL